MKLSVIHSGFGLPFEMTKQFLTAAMSVSGMLSGSELLISSQLVFRGALLPEGINLLCDPVPILVTGGV